MKVSNELYKEIVSGPHRFECSLVIGDGGPDSGHKDDAIASMGISRSVFEKGVELGGCVAAQISVKMRLPDTTIPRMAKLRPFVRAVNSEKQSGWLRKGTFYVDTRKIEDTYNTQKWITLNGYDAMMLAEKDCPELEGTDGMIAAAIAAALGCMVEAGTAQKLTWNYLDKIPAGEYSMREVLGYLAAAYGGCMIVNEDNELQLVGLNTLPRDAFYLVTQDRKYIRIGGVRIRV